MKTLYAVIAIILLLIPFSFAFNDAEYRLENIPVNKNIELINEAYNSKQISQSEKLLYSIQAVFDPASLPSGLKTDDPGIVKCATPIVNEVITSWDIMTPEHQTQAAAYLARPPLDSTYISPGGYFAIHYTMEHPDSVPPEDSDSNGVPDYVERIGTYVDSAYRYYHDNMEYLPPPDDGDGYYDIYLLRLLDTYGVTIREFEGDSSWNDYSSYIQMNSTFANVPDNEDPEGKIIGAQKVTCAHEYYHAVQMAYAYKSSPHLWWTEGTAVYHEDHLYEEVNDHYLYLPYFFNYPDWSLLSTNFWHSYSAFVFPTFLSEEYGDSLLKHSWEYIRWVDPLPALDSSLAPFGQKVKDVFPEFTVWNYFTETRYDPSFYDDGADYLTMPIETSTLSSPFENYEPLLPPDGLASGYIRSGVDTLDMGLLYMAFDGFNQVEWGFSFIAFINDSVELHVNCEVDTYGRAQCGLYDYTKYDSLVFIPCVVSPWQEDNDYTFSTVVHPYGDVNGSGDLNLLDLTYLINYIYKFGPEPKYDSRMADVNCDGLANLLDITYLINFLYKEGPEPCGYRPLL